MATEATFTIPTEEFPLGSVFQEFPDVSVELERIIPARDVVIPYFWVQGTTTTTSADVTEAFDDHPGVERIELVDSVDGQHLLRVEWALEYEGVLSTLTETEVPLIRAVGTADQWTFDVRGDTREDVAAFQQRCRELDIPVTLTALHALTPLESGAETVLTDAQREALALAHERGYFETPREVTMEDLGDELGISQQAVASRLRRGTDRILAATLPESEPAEPEP